MTDFPALPAQGPDFTQSGGVQALRRADHLPHRLPPHLATATKSACLMQRVPDRGNLYHSACRQRGPGNNFRLQLLCFFLPLRSQPAAVGQHDHRHNQDHDANGQVDERLAVRTSPFAAQQAL